MHLSCIWPWTWHAWVIPFSRHHSEIALHAPTVLYVDMKCPLKTTEYPSTSYPISADPFWLSHLAKFSFDLFLSCVITVLISIPNMSFGRLNFHISKMSTRPKNWCIHFPVLRSHFDLLFDFFLHLYLFIHALLAPHSLVSLSVGIFISNKQQTVTSS